MIENHKQHTFDLSVARKGAPASPESPVSPVRPDTVWNFAGNHRFHRWESIRGRLPPAGRSSGSLIPIGFIRRPAGALRSRGRFGPSGLHAPFSVLRSLGRQRCPSFFVVPCVLCGKPRHAKERKYSMVFARPSRRGMRGSQPRHSFAQDTLGLRRLGSSPGRGRVTSSLLLSGS